MRKDNIDLRKMNRIGVITVLPERLHRDDYLTIAIKEETPTQSFFKRMQQCSYKNGEDCIMSMYDDANLVLAHFDNDAIFLLSQNPVLSPRQFINVMINLQNCSNEMRNILERTGRYGYSDFGLINLNINFAEIELSTEMPSDISEKFILSRNTNPSFAASRRNRPQFGLTYNTGLGTITHKHMSQYGTSILGYLNEMIRVNPDIRLLMSNVICKKTPLDLRKAMMDAVGNTFDSVNYRRDGKISDATLKKMLESDDFRRKEQFLKEFEKAKSTQKDYRTSNNEKYQVYPALKYVVETFGDKKDIDESYLLEWYDGNPDNGGRAIDYALNNMLMAVRMEDDSYMASPRTLKEVKEYMRTLDQKAYSINNRLKMKQSSERENKR